MRDGLDSCLVDFDRPDQAAAAVRALVGDTARRTDMGLAARAAADRLLARDYAAEFRRIASTLGVEAGIA
jgi:hypothetical protein